MIADTTFVSDLIRERRQGRRGPALEFLAAHRAPAVRLSIITAGEVSVLFPNATAAWTWLGRWEVLRLHLGVVDAAADLDRLLLGRGERLGENDNWIAGFALYYREPLLSRDLDFDRVPGLRRREY